MSKIILFAGAGIVFLLLFSALFIKLFKKEKRQANDDSTPSETIYPMW